MKKAEFTTWYCIVLYQLLRTKNDVLFQSKKLRVKNKIRNNLHSAPRENVKKTQPERIRTYYDRLLRNSAKAGSRLVKIRANMG